MRSDDVIADRYRLVELVGSGGTGIVWLADDLVERRQVALKRPHSVNGSIRADFQREVDIARRVVHPNAVEVFDVVGEGDDFWLVAEYFPAVSLATRGRQEPPTVAAIGAQVAGALAAAHAHDVVHRDVTPGNILVDDDGLAKVSDFGISAWRAATLTSSGKISGTAAYVAPEVAGGAGATPLSDVFSLGATLFHAVEGEPPFGTGDADALLTRIRTGRRTPATKAGPLEPVLSALLQRDRTARPTAAQAADMLGKVAAGETVPTWVPGMSRLGQRVRAMAVATALFAVLMLIVLRPWESDADGDAHTTLGDPRTANPCALADPAALASFGEARIDANYGGFNRCDVLVQLTGGGTVDVMFEFDGPGPDDPVGVVVRLYPDRTIDSCDIPLRLADRNTVHIVAKTDDQIRTDLCAVASAATDRAEDLLRDLDRIPRRTTSAAARSLANVDACTLVTAADLATVPAYADATAQPGFANWDCRWSNDDDTGSLTVLFDRGNLASSKEGSHTRLSGHDVYVQEAGYGENTCTAGILNLEYQNNAGDPLAETALVVAEGNAPMADLCTLASKFAEPVAANLPAG